MAPSSPAWSTRMMEARRAERAGEGEGTGWEVAGVRGGEGRGGANGEEGGAPEWVGRGGRA